MTQTNETGRSNGASPTGAASATSETSATSAAAQNGQTTGTGPIGDAGPLYPLTDPAQFDPTATVSFSDRAKDPIGLPRLLAFLFPASAALIAVFNGIQQILIPAQVEAIDPAHKVVNLAVLGTFAAIASMVGLPLGGNLSDRTRSRWGRRGPWILVLSVISGVLIIAMGLRENLVLLGIVYTLLWLTSNMYQGALNAVLPDRIPIARRGIGSAIVGLGSPIGVLFGVQVASHSSQFLGYTIIAVVFVVASLLFLLGAREPSSVRLANAPLEIVEKSRAGVNGFFEAFRTRDFTLAFISRFALFLSYSVVSGYLYYTLSDYIGTKNLPGHDVATSVSTMLTVTILVWVVVATFCGWLADKLNRRKLFVGIAAIGLAATMFIPILDPTWPGMLLYSAFLGAFIGTYFAVDLAVMSLVLPHKDREGRDFGILAVATGLPGILAAPIAGLLITLTGGYASLYVFGTICAIIAGVTMLWIRKIR